MGEGVGWVGGGGGRGRVGWRGRVERGGRGKRGGREEGGGRRGVEERGIRKACGAGEASKGGGRGKEG